MRCKKEKDTLALAKFWSMQQWKSKHFLGVDFVNSFSLEMSIRRGGKLVKGSLPPSTQGIAKFGAGVAGDLLHNKGLGESINDRFEGTLIEI